MGTGFSKQKKQAKQFQNQIAQLKQQLTGTEVSGQAGAGLVKLTLNGDLSLKSIHIDKSCVDPNDVEGLETLIMVAHKDALSKLQQQTSGLSGLSF